MRPLGAREVRIALVDLRGDAPEARALLSPDELARAGRFVHDRHRRRFANARAALRRTLGALLGEDPAALAFEYGERGKPSLARIPALHFNLSHSGERALIAVTRLAPVGADVEVHREVEVDAIARRTYSDAENEALLALPAAERRTAFFRVWARKEAVVKARGLGIGADLRGFDVRVEAGARGLLAMRWPGESAAVWTLADVDAGPGAAAAVALPAAPASVTAE